MCVGGETQIHVIRDLVGSRARHAAETIGIVRVPTAVLANGAFNVRALSGGALTALSVVAGPTNWASLLVIATSRGQKPIASQDAIDMIERVCRGITVHTSDTVDRVHADVTTGAFCPGIIWFCRRVALVAYAAHSRIFSLARKALAPRLARLVTICTHRAGDTTTGSPRWAAYALATREAAIDATYMRVTTRVESTVAGELALVACYTLAKR